MQQRSVRTTRYYFAIVQDSNCRTKIDKGELRAGYIYGRIVSVDSVLIIAKTPRSYLPRHQSKTHYRCRHIRLCHHAYFINFVRGYLVGRSDDGQQGFKLSPLFSVDRKNIP